MRTRVMLLVTLGAMPLAGLLVAGAIEVRRDVVQASGQQVLELARLGAEQQDSIVREAKTLLRVLSRLTASGMVTQNNCYGLFAQILSDHPAVASLAMIDDQGWAGCISADPGVRLNVATRPFVRRLLRPGAVGFDLSDLVFSRTSGLPAIFIGLAMPAAPASAHRAGRPAGLLAAGLNLDWFQTLSGVVGQGTGSRSAVLLDMRDGMILASYPRQDARFRFAPGGPVLQAYRRAPGLPGIAYGSGTDGIERITGYASLPGTNNQIVLAMGVVRAEVLADADHRIAVAFGGTLVALLLAACAAWLAAWLIVILPLAAFSRTAARLGAGDLLARVWIPAWHAPELRQLAATLNTMAAAVYEAQARLARNAEELLTTNSALERLAVHLSRMRDKAEQASQAKSRFLAGMSHELRTPLSGILGYSQLLRDGGGLTSLQLARVEAMLGAGAHLLQMINRVLDLSEIEAEHVRLEAAPMDLPHLIESCLDLVRPSAHAKSLRLCLDFSPNAPTHIVADGTRLRQVLLNLLGNAVKFTQAGLIEIRVRLLSDAALRLEVADTGPGIPAERRHLLFQDFERLGDNPAVAEGAGLGLAISGRLVALMGGEFGYEENDGGGSVFWLRLPMAPAAATPQQAAGPAPDAQRGAALKVLVADDMEMNRDVAEAFLVAAGHTVTCVEGGMEAVVAAAANDFDVVLMDVRMADLDGLAATRRIRALGGARGAVPIVALTAQAFVGEMEECLAAGMNSRLTKPYAPGALLEAVTQAASGRGCQPVAPAPMADEAADKVVDQAGFDRTCSYLRPGVITTYLDTIAERSRAVLAALRAPGAADGWLEDAAHTLAGSAGMFGFERMSRTASSFEFALKVNNVDLPLHAARLEVAILETLEEISSRRP
jgi:signal transduction histidine kinase/DNA-binding NarL/FixJ family response regulator